MNISIDFNLIARIAKFVALFGFLLPWVTVSCSGTEILHATGVQLMTGHPEPSGPLAMGDAHAQLNEDSKPAVLVIAAFGVIAIGLFCSFLTRKQTAAATMLVTALLGLGLSYYSVQNMRAEMTRSIQHEREKQQQAASQDSGTFFSVEQQSQMGDAIASAIKVEEKEGFWITLFGCALAALFALLTLATKRGTAEAQAPESS